MLKSNSSYNNEVFIALKMTHSKTIYMMMKYINKV